AGCHTMTEGIIMNMRSEDIAPDVVCEYMGLCA
ncbi:hypothetical protein KIPB_013231, partial [Kipferlia bialata]